MSAPVRVSAAGAGMAWVDGLLTGSRGFWRAIIGLPNMVYNFHYRSCYPGGLKGLLSVEVAIFSAPVD